MGYITQKEFYEKTRGKCLGCELPEVLGIWCGNFTDCVDCGEAVSSFIAGAWEDEVEEAKDDKKDQRKQAKIVIDEFEEEASLDVDGQVCDISARVRFTCGEPEPCAECRRGILRAIADAWEIDAR